MRRDRPAPRAGLKIVISPASVPFSNRPNSARMGSSGLSNVSSAPSGASKTIGRPASRRLAVSRGRFGCCGAENQGARLEHQAAIGKRLVLLNQQRALLGFDNLGIVDEPSGPEETAGPTLPATADANRRGRRRFVAVRRFGNRRRLKPRRYRHGIRAKQHEQHSESGEVASDVNHSLQMTNDQ